MATLPAPTPGLLERAAELEELEGLIAGAASDAGRLLIVEGPPGIGKTALLAEAHARAHAAGLGVFTASGSELERDFTFGVARQLFEEPVRRLAAASRRRVLSGAAELSAELVGAGGAMRSAPGRPSDLFPLVHGLYWLCSNLSASRPLLLSLDDAHWADVASLKFVHYLARRIDGLPILLLLTLRSTYPEAQLPMAEALRADPLARRMEPRALSPSAGHRLVAEIFQTAPDRSFARACHEVSGGNPLLLTELARSLAGEGVMPVEAAAAEVLEVRSEAISRHVLVRLARLGAEARSLAEAVAVMGPGVEAHQAAGVAGISDEAALEVIDVLAEARVLAEDRPRRFRHTLLRNAVYDDMPAGRRAALHKRAARVLAEEGEASAAIAGHLLQAEPRGDQWVVGALREAARSAVAQGTPEIAATYLRRAMREPPEDPTSVLVELGPAAARAGEADAGELLRRAYEEADTDEVRVAAAVELGMDLANAGQLEEAAAVVRRALAKLDPQRRELVRPLEMMVLVMAECSVFARQVGADLIARAEEVVLRRGAAAPRGVLAVIAFERALVSGTATSAAATAEHALADGNLFIEQPVDSAHAYFATSALAMSGRMRAAERYLGDAIEHCRGRGSVRGIAFASAMRALVRHQVGELHAAEEDAQTFFELEAESDWSVFRLAASAALANVLFERGDLAGAQAVLADTRREVDHVLLLAVRASQARLSLAKRDSRAALRELGHCREWERDWGVRHPLWCEWRTFAALAHAMEGEHEVARQLADEQVELIRDFGAPAALGRALRVAGLVAGGERGIELLGAAVTELESSEASLDHARALCDLGAALRRSKRRADSREPLRLAVDLAIRHGAVPLAERARKELQATGARPRRLVLSGLESLTPRERQVARLAAERLTNREVAQELFVSKKTVETHLGSVYRKLEVSSRSALAEVLARES